LLYISLEISIGPGCRDGGKASQRVRWAGPQKGLEFAGRAGPGRIFWPV